jgi:general secretion pathway protein N
VEPEPPALTLVGTVVGADEAIAVFLDSSAREVMRLRIGEEGSGWTLRSIDPKSTVFEKDSREVTLSLPSPETGSGADSAEEAGTFVQAPFPPPSVNFPPPRARPPGPPPNGRPPGLGARRARPPAGNEF